MFSPMMYCVPYPFLFAHIFGKDKEFSSVYSYALMDNGILKMDNEQSDKNHRVWLETREISGNDEVVNF
jgi:hypothetical protein